MNTKYIKAPWFYRKRIRMILNYYDLKFEEDKSFFNSLFLFTCNKETERDLLRTIEFLKENNN